MSDTTSEAVETDQAAREASGAHPYGRYLEDFEVGAVYKHWPAKTVTEADDHLFCLITMNHHPLHINDVYAAQSKQDRGAVKVHTRVHNQEGTLVAEFKRLVLVPRRQPGGSGPAEGNVE
jgi:acyl dehydratase